MKKLYLSPQILHVDVQEDVLTASIEAEGYQDDFFTTPAANFEK